MSDKISTEVTATNEANGFDVANDSTFVITGGAKRWPDRLNGLAVRFNLPTAFTALPTELEGTFENVDALNHFLSVQGRNALINELAGWLNAKLDGGAQRSEGVAPADVVAYCATVKVTPPQRRSGGGAKAQVSALTAAVAEKDAKLSEAQAMMLSLLAEMPKAARAAHIEGLKAAGMIPADYTG